jgi:two-component system, OmpR family, heavy metal sensor histidine kinase CusS
MIRSIQGRVLAGMVGGAAMLLIVFGLVVYAMIRTALIHEFDAALISAVRLLATSAEREHERIELGANLEETPEFQGKGTGGYYELWGPDDRVSVKSPSLGTDELPRLQGRMEEPVVLAFELRPGLPVRAAGLLIPFRPDKHGEALARPSVTVVLARDCRSLLARLRWLRGLLAVAALGTLGLALLAGALIVRHALRPLNALASDIAAIHEDNLAARIETADMPTEMRPVQHRLNDLLVRLESSFKRERRFTADVAHELRTPLAGIRSTAEVTLARPRPEQEYREALAVCLEISRTMETLVNALLRLARTEADTAPARRERVVLPDLVATCWRSFSDKAASRGLTFENTLSADLVCVSDPEGLGLVLTNLLDNAVEYTNEAGLIRITGRRTDAAVEVTISNTGCPLSPDQVSQVFDAFWRADASRTNTGAHVGLGLSLVRRTLAVLGGTASATLETGGVFAVRVVVPADSLTRPEGTHPADKVHGG